MNDGKPISVAPAALFLCCTLIETNALRGTKPGLGPAAEFLSLLRQRTESKKGDRRLAPCGSAHLCSAKNGKVRNSPAAQTSDLLFPFSALHKWLRPKRKRVKDKYNVKINNKVKSNCNTNTMVNRCHSNKYECGCVDVGFDFVVAVVFDVDFDFNPLGTM
ncbi:hypothetical protein ACO0K9_21920 [Undibacterium sp. Ji50W]|uniref:hypothetical protein n=1 Tax=Undibacterium sp. Ji50W TaxID=3413041 RepID=UPI003BEF8DE8